MKRVNFSIVFFVLTFFAPVFGQGEWTTELMSIKRLGMGAAQLESKVYFGGGLTVEGVTNLVEVFDVNLASWSYLQMPTARNFSTAIGNGNNVFFAGGIEASGSALMSIDIFNTSTRQWSTKQFASPGFSLSAVTYDSIVMFAGGGDFVTNTETNVVNVYNAAADEWTTSFLSEARIGMGATVAGDLAFFAGGLHFSTKQVTDRVDIYNFTTGIWSTAALSEPRFSVGATTVGNKVMFAGGERSDGSLSKRVDIYDLETLSWSIDSLSVARPTVGAATVCNKAYFVGGMQVDVITNQIIGDFDEIDIYDADAEAWTVEYLPYNLFGHSTLAAGNKLLIGGGGTISGEFIQLRDDVRIYTCSPVSTNNLNLSENLQLYPNPTSGILYLDFQDNLPSIRVSIVDQTGRVLSSRTEVYTDLMMINTFDYSEGVYIVHVQTNEGIGAFRFVVSK